MRELAQLSTSRRAWSLCRHQQQRGRISSNLKEIGHSEMPSNQFARYALIGCAKLNDLNFEAYLWHVLCRIADPER